MAAIPAVFAPEMLSAADCEAQARAMLPPDILAWLEGGAGTEATVRANAAAFARFGIFNRVLRRNGSGHTGTSLFGQDLVHPILLAPVAQHGLVHPKGERATAQAARATGTVMVVSTNASLPLESVMAELDGLGWFQLYFQPQRDQTLKLVRRAEAAGCRALVLTLDAPVQPVSQASIRSGFVHRRLAFPNVPEPKSGQPRILEVNQSLVFQGAMADAADRDDLIWLRAQTRLPIIAKGITHPADARTVLDAGVDGIAVSNHGGRVLDGMPATLDLLPGIRAAVGTGTPLLFDGGVRTGTDVFKAIALGADAVMVGRPQLQALAVGGARAVAQLVRLLREELELTMALAGCFSIREVTRACLFPMEVPHAADVR